MSNARRIISLEEYTETEKLNVLRDYGIDVVDDGRTEKFLFPDGSVAVYDHMADPGHRWRVED